MAPPLRQKPMLRTTAVLAVLSAVVAFSLFVGGPAATAQEPGADVDVDVSSSVGSTTAGSADPSTDEGLLSDGSGDGSTGGSAIVENPLRDQADEPGPSTNQERKVWAVIGGLLFVALALTVVTVRYWRQTKPSQAPRSSTEPRSRRSGGRRAREADQPSPFEDLGTDIFVDET